MSDLRQRDGALRENWYIACLSSELPKGRPLARTVYDLPLVLWRDASGRAACLLDRCLHRHSRLSEGVVLDGQLGCPYHGWVYDRDGAVVCVPSAGDSGCPAGLAGARVRRYPVVEQDDCVWVWLGDGAPLDETPPYRFPHYKTPGWASYFMVTDFAGEVTNLVENFMDVPHTVFVHRGWFRRPRRRPVEIRVEHDAKEVLVTYVDHGDSIGFTGRVLNPKGEPVTHTDLFVMPNITRVDYHFGSKSSFVISSQCTPVSTLSSRVYTEITYRLGALTVPTLPFFKFYTRRVIQQDVEIMAVQARSLRVDPRPAFHHTDADSLHQAIEALRERATREPWQRGRDAGARASVTHKIWV
jgi:phenylpropionate dioxygenase-like ring-hydroxylating dioxygenase large terminal subunit